jgi:hypothetical protein
MAMTSGETYRCTNPNCGCEVKVTQGAKAGGAVRRLHAVAAQR